MTMGAVAALGVGILIANISQENQSAAPATPVAESPTTTAAAQAPTPSTPTTPPAPPAFPVKADYVGKIPISSGVITLEITIDGEKAVAYACDGNTVEVWLSGSAKNGLLGAQRVRGARDVSQPNADLGELLTRSRSNVPTWCSTRTRASPMCNGRRTDRLRLHPLCSPMELPSSTAGKPR